MRVLVSGGKFEERTAVAEALRAAGAEVCEAAGTPEALRLMALRAQRREALLLACDLEGSLAQRAAEAFPEGAPPVARVRGPREALAALRTARAGDVDVPGRIG